jgi:hypothetical protein
MKYNKIKTPSLSKTSILILMFFLLSIKSFSQLSITNVAPSATIDFSNTMQTSVGTNPSTAFAANGFSPNPTTAGRLNSNAWDITGFSFGTLGFGGTQTLDDFGRGSVTTAVISSGIYAYVDLPGSVANPALMVQPAGSDFAPGSIILKIANNGTSSITQLQVSYDLFVRNDENSSSSFNFSHSNDNIVYQAESSLDYTSPLALDAFQWTSVGVSPARSIILTGLNILPGGFYYIRWTSNDAGGTGLRDEFGLDNINVFGTYGGASPEINVTGYTVTILNGDTTPTVADGTDFAPIGNPLSTLLSTQTISYYLENLGGANLNISNITITGTNASDFTIFGPAPLGNIAAIVGSTISYNQLPITFDPSNSGLRTAIVSIFSNDSTENPYVFHIQGYGFNPLPEIDIRGLTGGTSPITSGSLVPNAFNNTLFTTQTVGVTNQTKDFKLRSIGTAPLILTGASPYVTITGANPSDFTLLTWPSTGSIPELTFETFSIRFSPTAVGIRTALVSIANNDGDENPYTFLIQGTGISPEMDVTGNSQPIVSGSTIPTFVNHTFFDYLNIVTGVLDRTFTIQNNGTLALTIGALTISGPGAADYSLITPPAASLAIGASTTFVIRFNPTTIGLKDATVSIVNNDLNESPYTFAISGYGVDYIGCSFGAIQTIAVQDFETTPATPTWNYSTGGTGVSVTNGVGFAIASDGGLTNRYIGARSLQVANGTATLTMTNINTVAFSDVELNVRVAAFSTTNSEGIDATTDRVQVSVSTNGGTTWSNELQVIGRTNSVWSYDTGIATASKVYSGTNPNTTFGPATAPSGSINYQTTEGYSTIVLSSLPKVANLAIRLSIVNNVANEIWAIDNVTLFGRREVTSTWNGATWSNGVPTSSIKAIINGNYNTTTHGNLSACKCDINAGRTVTVDSNTFLSIESDFVNAGTVTVENNGSFVQRNDFATNSGSINVKRFTRPVRKYDYTYWSSPVIGQTLFNLSPLTQSDKFFIFNPAISNWQNVLSSTVMTPAKGYIVRSPNTFSITVPSIYTGGQFIGQPNNGFIQIPVVSSPVNWNLIGNPYSSAIDADLFLGFPANTGVVGGTIYLWTHNTPITNNVYTSNDYAAYNLVGGIGTAAASANVTNNNTLPTGNIASGQSFFIQAIANGQATFNNSMRITGFNSEFYRNSIVNSPFSTSTSAIEKHRIWLNLTNNQGAFKQTLVGYVQSATNTIDRSFDGAFLNGANVVSIYSICENQTLVIQGRALPFDDNDLVPIGYSSTIGGEFSIGLENLDGLFTYQNIYLEDKLLNIVHNLKESSYTFTTEIGTFDSRFVLRYSDSALNNDDFTNQNNDLIVTSKDKKIELFSSEETIQSVAIYDILGRELFNKTNIETTQYSIKDVALNQQTLIVKVKLSNGIYVTKKVILQ